MRKAYDAASKLFGLQPGRFFFVVGHRTGSSVRCMNFESWCIILHIPACLTLEFPVQHNDWICAREGRDGGNALVQLVDPTRPSKNRLAQPRLEPGGGGGCDYGFLRCQFRISLIIEVMERCLLVGVKRTCCVTITEFWMLIRTGYHSLTIGLAGRAAHLPPTHTHTQQGIRMNDHHVVLYD